MGQGVSDREILVASSAAVTGIFATTGDPIVAGIHAYLDMVNDAGGIYGRQLRLLHVDDEYDGEKAKAAFHELVEQQGAFAYLSHFGAPPVDATLDDIHRVGLPVFGFATGLGRLYAERALTMEEGANCYPIQPIYITEGRVMVVRAISMFHPKKIGVLFVNDDTGNDLLAGINLQCRRLGQPIAARRVELDMSTLSSAVEQLKGDGVDCVLIAAAQAFFPTVAGEMAVQDFCRPVLTTYLNSIITIAQATHQLVKGKFDIYALSWLNYQDFRLDNLEEASIWLGDYAMNGYAHCGWISAHFLCEGLRRMGPGMPLWQDFPAIMERSPLQIPFGGRVDYAGGKRMGTQDMSLVQLDLGAPTGWRFIDGLRSMADLLGTV